MASGTSLMTLLRLWIERKLTPTEPGPVEILKPGTCECGHDRCVHQGGIGSCDVGYPRSDEWPNGAQCACQIFIADPDDDDDSDDEPEPITPTVDDLERIYKK